MLKRNSHFLMNIILCAALLLFLGCTRDKSKKAKTLKQISPETSQAFRASQQEDVDRDFTLTLDKLKGKNQERGRSVEHGSSPAEGNSG